MEEKMIKEMITFLNHQGVPYLCYPENGHLVACNREHFADFITKRLKINKFIDMLPIREGVWFMKGLYIGEATTEELMDEIKRNLI